MSSGSFEFASFHSGIGVVFCSFGFAYVLLCARRDRRVRSGSHRFTRERLLVVGFIRIHVCLLLRDLESAW